MKLRMWEWQWTWCKCSNFLIVEIRHFYYVHFRELAAIAGKISPAPQQEWWAIEIPVKCYTSFILSLFSLLLNGGLLFVHLSFFSVFNECIQMRLMTDQVAWISRSTKQTSSVQSLHIFCTANQNIVVKYWLLLWQILWMEIFQK